MAWVEQVGRRYRVRRKVDGRTVTDSAYLSEVDALRRVTDLDAARRVLRRRLSDVPAPTLRQWVDEWLPAHTAGPVTLAKYECMLRVHILPRFGTLRLDAISRNDVKKFAVDLRAKVSAVSARTIVSVLGLVLREAIEDHHLYFDPTARLRLRDIPVVARPIASPRQVWQIAGRMPDQITRTLVITASYTGMRVGELLGLDRRNVLLHEAAIRVDPLTGALHEVGGKRWLGPPKTPASVRRIALPPFLVDGLARLLAGHPYATVFCSPSGQWLWRTTFVERSWRPACDGSPQRGWEPILPGFRFHDQRHTHRTWMKEDGIADPLAYERMGHKMPGIEAVYDHPTDQMRPALITALQRRWDNSGSYWSPAVTP